MPFFFSPRWPPSRGCFSSTTGWHGGGIGSRSTAKPDDRSARSLAGFAAVTAISPTLAGQQRLPVLDDDETRRRSRGVGFRVVSGFDEEDPAAVG